MADGYSALTKMTDVKRILSRLQKGQPQAAAELLPLVYDELRKLAAQKLAHEKPGHTLDGTALVNEAYLRLVGDQQFDNRRHFFAAAAEAMRRILVESARRKGRLKRGGRLERLSLEEHEPAVADRADEVDLLAVHAALERFEAVAPRKAQLVKLRYFAGFTLPEAAEIVGVSRSTAEADWTYAKAWLKREMEK
jgi:RNA polymerase sigma factor (TIGR02999 family)